MTTSGYFDGTLGRRNKKMHEVKSVSGRTTWNVTDGCLSETSPQSARFTLSATDTLILANLLLAHYDEIADAAKGEMVKSDRQKVNRV